jgi:hypothetical protein
MDLPTFRALLCPAGHAALTAAADLAPTDETFLSCFNRLSKHLGPDLARAALETALVRHKARARFERAAAMFFTREALEQASSEAVSRHRAGRFRGIDELADLCCGIGGDTLALATLGPVLAIDLDPLRLAMAEQNLRAYELRDRVTFQLADVLSTPLPAGAAVFCDPDRRPEGRRRLSVRDYRPPLPALLDRLAGRALGVKLAPGLPVEEVAAVDGEVEFLSARGELKECVLWLGPLRTTRWRATLLPGGHSLAATKPVPIPPPAPVGAYLYDPDPAVVRSGLLGMVAEQLQAHPLDSTIAYLTSDRYQSCPFARAHAITEWHPFQLKRLRQRLRQLRVGRVTVLKRGFPLAPEELIRRLRLDGPEHRTLILTRCQGRPVVLLGGAVGP